MTWLKTNLLALALEQIPRRNQPPWPDPAFLNSLARLHGNIPNQLFSRP